MDKKLFQRIFWVIACLAILLATPSLWFIKSKDIHFVFSAAPTEHAANQLRWNNDLNLEQSYNACGPYSTMAYAFVKSGVIYDPETINREIGGRHGDGLTFPWGITDYLNLHNAEAHLYFLGLLSKQQKISWIKSKIDQGHPVIVLIGTAEWAHYLTILGYKNGLMHKYDSYLSGDQNGEVIGNSDADADWIVDGIEGVRFHGLPTPLAISY